MRKRHFEIAVLAILAIILFFSEGQDIEPKQAKFAYADLVELIAIKDDCMVYRWGLTHIHYATTEPTSLLNGTLLSTKCSREIKDDKTKYVFPITGGTQFVRINHNLKKKDQSSSFDDYYEFMFFNVEYSRNFYSYMKKPFKYQLGQRKDITVNPFECFEDLSSIYCLRSHLDGSFKLHRYELRVDNHLRIEREGTLDLILPNEEIPSRILFDNVRVELVIFYKSYNGHESYLADIRSLYGIGRRGQLVQVPFTGENVLSVTSFHGHRYFVVKEPKTNDTGLKLKIYHTIVGHRAVNPLKGFDADYKELTNINTVGIFIKPDYWINDNYQTALTKLSIDSCSTLSSKLKKCQEKVLKFEGWTFLEYFMVGILSFLFLILVILLLLYLLCCVKTKRHSPKKRRKHQTRCHRKTNQPSTKPQSKIPDDEIEVDPETKKYDKEFKKENESKEKKQNTFVKKLKAFGGVDYSSSSSDEKKDSQIYYSARDTFDKKNSSEKADKPGTISAVGENNNVYENLGSLIQQTTGAGPTEQEIHDKNDKQKSRNFYMKPTKKKKT